MDIFIGMHRAYTLNTCSTIQKDYKLCTVKCEGEENLDTVAKCKRVCLDRFMLENAVKKCFVAKDDDNVTDLR